MSRQLNVAPEVAKALNPSYVAQRYALVGRDTNVCPECGELVLTDTVELVLLTEDGTSLIELTHPDCLASGIYHRSGIRELASKQPEGIPRKADFYTVTFIVPERPKGNRLFCVVDVVRMPGHMNSDPVEIWAEEIGLPPLRIGGEDMIRLAKKPRLRAGNGGLELVYGGQVTGLNNGRETALNWINEADSLSVAWLILGRGIRSALDELNTEPTSFPFESFIASISTLPCWGAPVRVERPRPKILAPWTKTSRR